MDNLLPQCDIFPCTGYKATKRLGFGNEANILHGFYDIYMEGNSVQCILTIKILWVTFVIL